MLDFSKNMAVGREHLMVFKPSFVSVLRSTTMRGGDKCRNDKSYDVYDGPVEKLNIFSRSVSYGV